MSALFRGLIDQGHTQKDIAASLEIDQTYVSQLANGKKPRGVGAELIRHVLAHYRVDPWYFFDFPLEQIPDYRLYIIPRGRQYGGARIDEERRNGPS